MPTIVGILTFISMIMHHLWAGWKQEKYAFFNIFSFCEHLKFHAQLSWALKKFDNAGPDL